MKPNDEESSKGLYTILLAIGLFYPAAYDITQLLRSGCSDYLSDPWNYADMVFIYGGMINILLQNVLGHENIWCKVIMCIIVF